MSVRTSLLLSAAAIVMVSGTAFAADLPSRTVEPVAPYVAPPPVFTWTGFYVGVNAGAAFGNNGHGSVVSSGFSGVAPGTAFLSNSNGDDTRFTGGGQVGYNWQAGALVFGIEADFDYLSRNNSSVGVPAGTATPYFVAVNHNNSNFLGTVRGRLGWAVDRALFYVTGGLAYGGSNSGGSITYFPTAGGPFAYTSSGHNSNLGYAAGGGLEYAFTPSWSGRVEYLYINRGNGSTTFFAPAGGPAGTFFTVKNHNTDNLVRVGLNYRF